MLQTKRACGITARLKNTVLMLETKRKFFRRVHGSRLRYGKNLLHTVHRTKMSLIGVCRGAASTFE